MSGGLWFSLMALAGGAARQFHVVDKDILDRDEAALVSAVVLGVLRDDLTGAYVDAYSDYDDEMPQEIRAVQAALAEIGAAQHRRDPGMGIELDLSNPDHARLLHLFAPWSINVDLLGPDGSDMGGFHDCGMWVHFRAAADQAVEIGAGIAAVGAVVSMAARDEQRRQVRRGKRAARRTAIVERVRRLLPGACGPKDRWPKVTPPTVPPAGPPQFDSDSQNPPRKEGQAR